jgi:dTDP-4-amino-4,6-dideoxygalactose transaminase
MIKKIPFNIPTITKDEIRNLDKLLKLKHYSANGYFTEKCITWLKKNIKCKDALLVHSCTAALEMCALLLNIKKNDEIIMPSYTFVSTANAFVLRGAVPIFVDIDPKTLNLDSNKIENAITKRTKAIVAVHYAGVSCEMDSILKIAKKNKLYVIEDAAQAILSSYKGKPLGSIGDLATLSFHESKNIHCGEGGALLINNKKFIRRAKIIRDKGTNREDFKNNNVKKYTWVDLGSSYGLSEINAAFLYAQLLKAKNFTKKRIKAWNNYHHLFYKLEKQKKLYRPQIPNYTTNNAHIYYLIIKKSIRDKLIKYFKSQNIISLFHYIPLHTSFFFKKFNKIANNLHSTDLISKSLIRLPLHHKITIIQQKKVLNKIVSFLNKNAEYDK